MRHRDAAVAFYILRLLESGWLKKETGTPATLAAQVESLLAKQKVTVEVAEVVLDGVCE